MTPPAGDLEHPRNRDLQRRFLRVLESEAPEVLESLREEVFPLFPRDGWTCPDGARFPELPDGEWRTALTGWQREWHLADGWIRQAAIGSLRYWAGLARVGSSPHALHFGHPGTDATVASPRRFDPDLPRTVDPTLDLEGQEERIREAFDRELTAFMDGLRSDLEASGWEERPERREGRRTYSTTMLLRAQARHLTKGETWREIAEQVQGDEHRKEGILLSDFTNSLRASCKHLRDDLGLTPKAKAGQQVGAVNRWAETG